MLNIIVTGATGLLGGILVPHLHAKGHKVTAHGLTKKADVNADLTDREAVFTMMDSVRPDCVINLVNLSNVDRCEEDPDLAYRMNALPAENLAAAILDHHGARLVHISTDHLYDNPAPNPEERIVIRNTYALSKHASELAALRVPGAIVLRVNFFGKSRTTGRLSFSDSLIENFRSGKPMTLFTDVLFSPLSMTTLSEMIRIVAESGTAGVFNLGSRNGMSKRDFALSLARRLNLQNGSARDGLSTDVNLKARRPVGMLMDSSRFERAFNVTLPALEDEIMNSKV
jgi:dTDP-4-dehydrorhamnose reductase